MSKQEKKLPDGCVFTLTVPTSRDKKGQKLTFYLKDLDEVTFMAAKSLVDTGKTFDGMRLMLKSLSLPGSDSVDILKDNFIAMGAATAVLMELLVPEEAELKKN